MMFGIDTLCIGESCKEMQVNRGFDKNSKRNLCCSSYIGQPAMYQSIKIG